MRGLLDEALQDFALGVVIKRVAVAVLGLLFGRLDMGDER